MSFKIGDRVKVIERDVTAEDRKANRYYTHMIGLTGSIQAIYSEDQVSILVENDSMPPVTKRVHGDAEARLRRTFAERTGEEAKKGLTTEELNFPMNFVILARTVDLVKA